MKNDNEILLDNIEVEIPVVENLIEIPVVENLIEIPVDNVFIEIEEDYDKIKVDTIRLKMLLKTKHAA